MYNTYFLHSILDIVALDEYMKTVESWKCHLLFLTDKLVKINWVFKITTRYAHGEERVIKGKMTLPFSIPFYLGLPSFHFLFFTFMCSVTTEREEFSTRLSSDLCPASSNKDVDTNMGHYLL